MPNPVDFSTALDEYRSLPNRIKFLREQVLALDRGQFIEEMKMRNRRHEMSSETLRKMEREGDGSTATVTRILDAMNALLKEQGYEPISRTAMLAPWEPIPAPPAQTNSAAPAPPALPVVAQAAEPKLQPKSAQTGGKASGKRSKSEE